jgi:hypothetical protein
MKKVLLVLLLACGVAYGDTTPNLVTNTWTGVGAYAPSPGDCCSNPAGSLPLYDTNTNTIRFSYGQATVKQTLAVNQALANAGAGIQITGYDWGYDLRNNNSGSGQGGVDTITSWTWLTNSAGTTILSNSLTHNTRMDWTRFSGTQTLSNAMLASDLGSLGISFNSKDSGYWAGLYGPEVRNVSMSLRYTADVCASDPLSSPNCPNYATAYLNLQCSGNALYSPQCPGYAQAYFTQQCTVNALYDPSCPGYASAYLTYQCSINPLYATTCTGYTEAYQSQQCSINPLYSRDCPGYAQAYFNQQCTANPLYSVQCEGYAQAYFNQQCSINGLYNQRCSNYSETYAKKMLLEQQSLTSTVATANTVAKTTETTTSGTAVVSDPVVNQTLTTTTTSVSPATAATAIVPLTTSTSSSNTGISNVTTSSVSTTTAVPTSSTDTKPAAPTARQEMQAKREAAAKAEAVEKGKNLAKEMGKAADMESQKQVQNVVIQAMGFTPGFDTYNKSVVPDSAGYRPFTVYNKQTNVDNVRLGRRMYGPSDALHDELVQSQWGIK